MNLEKQKFFKGDSHSFVVTLPEYPNLDEYTVRCYINTKTTDITTNPAATLVEGDGLEVINDDAGAQITVGISTTLSTALSNVIHYYSIKIESFSQLKTVANGMIVFKEFKDEFYTDRFRRFVKDIGSKNKGEFLNLVENEDEDMEIYLHQSVSDFNHSFFLTSFVLDDFPNETLLFIGALLKLLISNGVLNARCALTYQDAGGIIIQDMDRWARYAQLFNQLYAMWKNGVLETKRAWNIDSAFDEVPSDMRWGGFDDLNILDIDITSF